ncbi:pyridoxal phosphate-dependent transferase [Podospora australis]|uniref:Pyridoxal phosphate-dependent transferase n=1 Tax=Podospora australis TaxID=1536484 RepID=A0AAN6WTN7_9PEZI|nr:pyridoxal phosphate-dependent transferase [Podospora australis]
MALLNMHAVKESFPSLAGNQVFFDNAAGTQILGAAVERIRDYLINTNVQLGASYSTSKKATSLYNEAYTAAARFINASRDEIALGPSTTQLFRNVSNAFHFQPGDEIILSIIDHESNIAPWIDLAQRQNLNVKWWRPTLDSSKPTTYINPQLEIADLTPLLSSRTRLVAFTHASNILGTIHDVEAITSSIRMTNPQTLVCVDGAAYAAHRPINVKDLGVDLYAFSWSKVYGPHISQLYASPLAISLLSSLGFWFKGKSSLQDKIGLSGASYELLHALLAVIPYLSEKWEGILSQETALTQVFLDWLNTRGRRYKATIFGDRSADPKKRVATISFTVEGWNSKELVQGVEAQTDGKRYGFNSGDFSSFRLVYDDVLGLQTEKGVVRVSMAHYNTVEEVEGLLQAVEEVLGLGSSSVSRAKI